MAHTIRPPEITASPERFAKGDLVIEATEARPGSPTRARSIPPIETLWRRKVGGITDAQYEAAQKFERDFNVAMSAGSSTAAYDGVPPPDSYVSRTPSQRAIDANARLALARKALGVRMSACVVVVVGEGHPVSEWARRVGMTPKAAIGYFRAALDRLCDHYGI